ncbi:MAG: primase [Alphaproteobacteria bacterium]|nr:primase [Alphaproteobacteria bacterium]
MLDKRFIDELRGRLTLSDIIGRTVKLTRAGREFRANCPFHGEKTPSFYVNNDKGFFHCFGCGAHGDVVSYRMRHDNITFMEAVESLAGEAGLEIPKPDPQSAQKFDEHQRLLQIMERVAKWFEAQLKHGQNGFALRYLKDRGLSDETISQFRLGYAPNNWDGLREALLAEGIKAQDLQTLGVLKQSAREDKSDKPYSFFRGRIIFPVSDARGRIIAFGGRHLDAAFAGQDLKEKPPKYINSAESPLFNKSAVLYGLARARAHVGPDKPLILVEGYMDVIALAQAGFTTAVAPLGTALTEDHMQLAWKIGAPEAPPLLCFDGDPAGQSAANRAIERLLPHFNAQRSVRVVFMPHGEDPDSLVRKQGADAVSALFAQALGVFDTLWQKELAQSPPTPEGRAALQARLETAIKQIGDPLLQQNYRQALRDRLFHLGRAASQPPANKTRFNPGNKGRNIPAGPPPRLQQPALVQERRIWQVLLLAVINHPFLLVQNLESFGMLHIPDPPLESLREALVQLMHQEHKDEALTSDDIKQFLSKRGLNDIVTNLMDDSIYRLYGFARPDSSADMVLEGWKDVWTRLQRKTVNIDKNKLLQEVKTEYSDDAADRLFSLNQQQYILDDTL